MTTVSSDSLSMIHGKYFRAIDIEAEVWSDLAGGHLETRLACHLSVRSPQSDTRVLRWITEPYAQLKTCLEKWPPRTAPR